MLTFLGSKLKVKTIYILISRLQTIRVK